MPPRKERIVGKRILCALQTPWQAYEGVELPGLAGKLWYSCHCFLRLEGNDLIHVEKGKLSTVLREPQKLIPPEYPDEDWRLCYGKPIREVALDESGCCLFILVGEGLYVCDDHDLPGGNRFWLSSFKNWSEEDRMRKFQPYWERMPIVPWDL
jgi:hypothetical protein